MHPKERESFRIRALCYALEVIGTTTDPEERAKAQRALDILLDLRPSPLLQNTLHPG